MINIFNYIDRPSPIHGLTGATKLVCMLLWTFAAMVTFDTRYLAILAVLSLLLFRFSKIKFRDVKVMVWVTVVFLLLNNALIFVFSPQHGTELYNSVHVIFGKGRFALTQEQLFYHLNLFLKVLLMV